MQKIGRLSICLVLIGLTFSGCKNEKNNISGTLLEDKKQGFVMLFDCKDESLSNFKGVVTNEIPESVWAVKDGQIICTLRSQRPEGAKGSIVTREQYSDFDFRLEYKLDTTYEGNINSGIKYFAYPGKELGLEYQIFDSDIEIQGPHATGDLYDLIEATQHPARPRGQWNEVRIVSQGNHVTHWLNGIKVLEFERGGKAFRAAVANSKFKDRERFGEAGKGHILLQDHGGAIAFRNIRIKSSMN